ncbi:MAG: DUF11 domain-containing protein [Chloroflexi bacterium]|nr:DUF11 domain-containing protein [Chloroflexota bacterium]
MTRKNLVKLFQILLISSILVVVASASFQISAVRAESAFDLQIGLKAPQHVAPGTSLVVNLSYGNIGTETSPADTQIQVSLPAGLTFVSAVDQDGNPMPPTSIDGDLLTWDVGALPAGSCCRHIWVSALVSPDLIKGTTLTTTAQISSATVESNLTNNTASVTSTVCNMVGSAKKATAK